MDILFYHLEQRPLEHVLPVLLEKSLEKGWRAVVESASAERLAAIDAHLWTYSDESFLPHAMEADGDKGEGDEDQPILLTATPENRNKAQVRFFIDRAVPREGEEYERLVYLFSGNDPDAIAEARVAWKALKDSYELTYWQQNDAGRWEKKATS